MATLWGALASARATFAMKEQPLQLPAYFTGRRPAVVFHHTGPGNITNNC